MDKKEKQNKPSKAKDWIARWDKRLQFAFSFMTRFTVNKQIEMGPDDYPRIAVLFPIIGLTVGLAGGILALFFAPLNVNLLTATFCVLGGTFMTGGMHIDGLGDTFDALGSNRTKERMLEIMKDSTMGTMGVLALFFDLFLKIILYSALFSRGVPVLAAAVAVPVMGRLALCTGAVTSKCARPGGMGSWFIDGMNAKDLVACLILSLITLLVALLTMPAFPLFPPAMCAVAMLTGLIAARPVASKLEGITGDTLGMLNELGEVTALLTLLALYVSFY